MNQTKYTQWIKDSFVPFLRTQFTNGQPMTSGSVRIALQQPFESDVQNVRHQYARATDSHWGLTDFTDRVLRALKAAERLGYLKSFTARRDTVKHWRGGERARTHLAFYFNVK